MQNNRLGCFSASAIITFIITLIIIGAVAINSGNAMFSPGELSNFSEGEMLGNVQSHGETDNDCASCHVIPWSAEKMSDRCQACHNGIKLEVTDVSSLHGALIQNNQGLECRDCHPDHRGADAPLTEMIPATFPHEMVGFSLASHQIKSDDSSFTCSDCHTEKIILFDVAVCAKCHQEIDAVFSEAHALAYGGECLACHDGLESYGADFDHNQSDFALTGKHAPLICTECHLDARNIEDFRNTPADCAACHTEDDIHAGEFSTNCTTCHTTEGWTPATFDHNLTAFKLEGKHLEAECEKCHLNEIYQGTPTDCFSCHEQDDEHQGEFGTDCAACHSTDAWTPASFDHNLSNFPLTGAHLSVGCTQCHASGSFDGLSSTCVSCHADPAYHLGAFGTDCVACHSTSAWSPAEFNLAHIFPLDHGESGVSSCATCHPRNFTTYTCYSCHEHSEADIREEHLEEGISNYQNCMECHWDGREHDDDGGDNDDD